MQRDLQEVLASQEVMIGKDQSTEREKFKQLFNQHLDKTIAFITQMNWPILFISHQALLKNPNQEIVVTAIPINLEHRRQKSFSNKHDSIKIGFFGRLHKDRGTENFIEFMKKLLRSHVSRRTSAYIHP